MALTHNWSTNLPASQDTGDPTWTEQPTLVDSDPGTTNGDRILVSQLHALRNKLQYACVEIGDENNLPVTSLRKRVKDLEDNGDVNALHKNVDSEISTITEKGTPVSGDLLIIEDSAGGTYAKKKVQIGNLPGSASSMDDAYNVGHSITVDDGPIQTTGDGSHFGLDFGGAAGNPAAIDITVDHKGFDYTKGVKVTVNDDGGSIIAGTAHAFQALLYDDTADNESGIYGFTASNFGTCNGEKVAFVAGGSVDFDYVLKGNGGGIKLGSANNQIEQETISTPSAAGAGWGSIYVGNDGGDEELFFRDGSGNYGAVQITKDGAVNASGGGQTNTVTGSSGITNVGDNVDADLVPTYGTGAGTICEGNDSRVVNAIHDNVAGEIHAIANKDTPIAADEIVIEDSADSWNKKRITLTDLLGGGGSTPHEEEFTTDGTETPGSTKTFGPLNATPQGGGTADTPSGYDILVFRNGTKMKYSATPSTYSQYYYDDGDNEIDVLASGDEDEFEVVYRS